MDSFQKKFTLYSSPLILHPSFFDLNPTPSILHPASINFHPYSSGWSLTLKKPFLFVLSCFTHTHSVFFYHIALSIKTCYML